MTCPVRQCLRQQCGQGMPSPAMSETTVLGMPPSSTVSQTTVLGMPCLAVSETTVLGMPCLAVSQTTAS